MPRKLKGHKPKKIVDWKLVDKWLECDGSAHQIAAKMGMHYDTLVNRFFDDERNVLKDEETGEVLGTFQTFSEYIAHKKQAGVLRLLEAATDEAIKNRTPSMLVFLLKNRAGYTDKRETTHSGNLSVYPNIEITKPEDGTKDV
jgi:hypothetical protein